MSLYLSVNRKKLEKLKTTIDFLSEVVYFQRSNCIWPLRLVVRTPPFHGGNTSSSLVGVTTIL